MKIKFILPSVQNTISNSLELKYLMRLFNKTGKNGGTSLLGCLPSAIPLLAALTPRDIKVVITDENIEYVDYDEKVDLVAISFLTLTAPRAYEIADEFRRRGVYVIAGGLHPTMFPEEAAGHADTIVIGEAEEIWPLFLEDFRNGRQKKIYREERKPDLQSLVIPRWELMKNRYYNIHHVQTTRGCPFDCDFCSVRIYQGLPRYKPVSHVVEEIKVVKKYNRHPAKDSIVFSDDNIISNPGYAKDLFRALIPLKIRWTSQCSINIARDEELMDLAQRSGCQSLMIGFESISQESLNGVNKGKLNKITDFKEAVRKLHAHKFTIFSLMILGLDGDDETSFRRTYDFIMETGISFPVFNILTPLPGTRLYTQMEKEKRLLHHRWDEYNGSTVVFTPRKMSAETLQEGFYWLFKNLFSYDAIFDRIEKLWDTGTLKLDRKFTLLRIIVTVILTFERLKYRGEMADFIKRIVCILWEKKGISIEALLLYLNYYEYAKSLPEPKIQF